MSTSKSVLFVCLGNICRSPTGEGLLQHLVNHRGLAEQIMVDSAGTANYHSGSRADHRMRAAAKRRGYELMSRARQVTHKDMEMFDLVLAMDQENFHDLESLHSSPTADLKMLSYFLDDQWPADVPDPYYGGDEGFEFVLDMIEAACPSILNHLLGHDADG